MISSKWFAVSAAVVTLVGCSDGAVGEKGLVRFSQVVNFVETDDFSRPLVRERTVLIRLERAERQPFRERAFPELTLEVTGGAAQVLPLGFARYAVRLDEEKTYRFLAKDGDVALDAIDVRAKKGSSMRLHAKAQVTTTGSSGSTACAVVAEVDLEGLTLAPNQSAAFFVVPLDEAGEPMLGMLQLTAKTGRDDIELDTPLFFEGGSPNALTVTPKKVATTQAELELREPALGRLTTTLNFTDTLAPVTCR